MYGNYCYLLLCQYKLDKIYNYIITTSESSQSDRYSEKIDYLTPSRKVINSIKYLFVICRKIWINTDHKLNFCGTFLQNTFGHYLVKTKENIK